MDNRLSASLQESALTLLAYSEIEGRIGIGILTKDHFEPPYDRVAGRLIDFRRKFEKAPGDAHLDDLFDDLIAEKSKQKEIFTRILMGMHQQSDGLNAKYLLTRLTDFVRHQTMKNAILEAGEILQHDTGAEHGEEAEQIIQRAMKQRIISFDAGTRLGDKKKALRYFDTKVDVLPLKIRALDQYELGPARGQIHFFLAPQNRGKSWWLDHVGIMAMLHRDRVLHISLEMAEESVVQRYHQSIFAIAKRKEEEFQRAKLTFDNLGRIDGLDVRRSKPKHGLDEVGIRKFVTSRMDHLGTKLDRVIVKGFPTASLSFRGYCSYLDSLEDAEGFIPDTVLIDYPKIMAYDRRDPRVALGTLMEELRGEADRRNHRLAVVHQGTRASATATRVGEEHVSEDWSLMQTADVAITYSQTEEEKELNLARLFVAKGRHDRSKFTVIINQQYEIGQFVLDSGLMQQNHFKLIDEKLGKKKDND